MGSETWAQGRWGLFARTGVHGGSKGEKRDARTGLLQGRLEVQL